MSINSNGIIGIELKTLNEVEYNFKIIFETKNDVQTYQIIHDYESQFLFLKFSICSKEELMFSEDLWFDTFNFSGKLIEKRKINLKIEKNFNYSIGIYKVSNKGGPEMIYLNKHPKITFLYCFI